MSKVIQIKSILPLLLSIENSIGLDPENSRGKKPEVVLDIFALA